VDVRIGHRPGRQHPYKLSRGQLRRNVPEASQHDAAPVQAPVPHQFAGIACQRAVDTHTGFAAFSIPFVFFSFELPYVKRLPGCIAVFTCDQAGVLLQGLDIQRFAMRLEIRRRGHKNTLVACQPPGDPLRSLAAAQRPQPDGAIKPFCCQVGQLFRQLQLHFQFGVTLLEACQRWPEPEPAEPERGRQPDFPRRLFLPFLQLGFQVPEALQQHDCAVTHGFAFRRRADAAGRALKQLLAKACFKCGEPLCHRGWRNIQAEGRRGQAAMVAYGQHQFKIASLH